MKRTYFWAATTLLALVTASWFSPRAWAADVVVTDKAFVVKNDEVFWSVPFDGAKAKRLTRNRYGHEISFLTYLRPTHTFFSWFSEKNRSYFASSPDAITWSEVKGKWSGKYDIDRSQPIGMFVFQDHLYMEISYVPAGDSATYNQELGTHVLCTSADEGATWKCNSAVPHHLMTQYKDMWACGDYIVYQVVEHSETPAGTSITGVLYFSPDGKQWKRVETQRKFRLGTVGDKFFCVKDQIWASKSLGPKRYQLFTVSPSGLTPKTTVNDQITGLVSDGRKLIAYAFGRPYVSHDGGKHFKRAKGELPHRLGVAPQPVYSHGMYIARGVKGFMQSKDGITWKPVE